MLYPLFLLLLITSSSVFGDTIQASQASEEVLERFYKGESPSLTLKFCRDEEFPLLFDCKSSFFSFHDLSHGEMPYYIKLKEDLYIRCKKDQTLLFSLDQKRWIDFHQFCRGEFSIGFQKDDFNQPIIKFGLDVHKKSR